MTGDVAVPQAAAAGAGRGAGHPLVQQAAAVGHCGCSCLPTATLLPVPPATDSTHPPLEEPPGNFHLPLLAHGLLYFGWISVVLLLG
jgi:hypothetical protein